MILTTAAAITATILFLGLIVFAPGIMNAQQQQRQPAQSLGAHLEKILPPMANYTSLPIPIPPSTPPPGAPQKQHTQLTPQQQQLSHCDASVLNSLPPLVPAAIPVCPGSPLMPAGVSGISAAQIQSDLAKHPPFEKLNAALAQIQARHAAQPSASFDQILQELTNEGLMNCPIIKNPAAPCVLTPKTTAGISPPTIG